MSGEKYIEYVFLTTIYRGEFDGDYAYKWMDSVKFKSLFLNTMRDALIELGFDPGNRYDYIVENHIKKMLEVGAISSEGDDYTGDFLSFDAGAKDAYVKMQLDEGGVSSRLERLGSDAMRNALARIATEEAGDNAADAHPIVQEERVRDERALAPASDRIVTFNDNQISELEAQATAVIQGIEAQNQLDGEPGLRELIIGQLRAGREFIRVGTFKLHFLQVTLIETLRYLAKRYEKEAIGALATALIAALLKHLGLEV